MLWPTPDFPKKGKASVEVTRQYSGTLGRVDKCQVATRLHMASNDSTGCVGLRLYLSEEWASDLKRRKAVGVSDEVQFRRKWHLALDLLDEALASGAPPRLGLAEAEYGSCAEFRDGLDGRQCHYWVGVSRQTRAWPLGSNPQAPPKVNGRHGCPRTQHRDANHQPLQLSEGSNTPLYRRRNGPDGGGGTKSGHFAFARVRLTERNSKGRPPSEELWPISEWRPGNDETKFLVFHLAAEPSKRVLVRLAELRWRVERDYRVLKGHVVLDHFEGRAWRGFHHHVTLCAVAHGFLILPRRLFPPQKYRQVDVADGPASNSTGAVG